MSRLVVIGSTTRDYVDGGAGRTGGAPLYAARALAHLGAAGTIVTRCAHVDRALVNAVEATGLPVLWHASSATATFRIENREGERVLHLETLTEPWSAGDVDAVDGGRPVWIQVAPLWRGEFPGETLAALAARGRVCLDGQGIVRPGQPGQVRLDASFDRTLLDSIDVLHLSTAELHALGLQPDAASLRSLDVAEVVVTLGERGSLVWDGAETTLVPAERVAGIDPTGAGDAFMAVYLSSRCAGREPVAAARAAASAVHSLLAQQRGTIR